MTDRELAEKTEAHLKKTTITYADWKRRVDQGKYTPPDGSTTEWGKAFAALDQIGQAPIPPDPTFPPSWAQFSDDFDPAPASRWTWSFGPNGNAGFPNQGAGLVSDGASGKAVRLTSPVVGGNGALSAFYDQSGQWGSNGVHQMGQVQFKRVNQNQFIWIWEWHENFPGDINSCAIGLNPNGTIRVQVSGGNVSGHQYTQVNDTVVQTAGQFHLLEWDIVWSPSSSGRFKALVDKRVVCDVQRPTLLTDGSRVDTTVIGGYCYTPPGSSGDQVMDFAKFAVGSV